MSKSITLSSWSNLSVLCCLQCSKRCATSRHRNGPVGLWRLSYVINVHSGSHKRSMLMLPHGQLGLGSKSGGACKLWELQDVANVPVWSTICKMCSLQFCHISRGISKCCTRTEVQQLEIAIHLRNFKFTTSVFCITNILFHCCITRQHRVNFILALYRAFLFSFFPCVACF